MSSFTEPLAYSATDIFTGGSFLERPVLLSGVPTMVCELVGARRLFCVNRGFVYDCGRTQESIRVEDGFLCDLGSIPRFARCWLSPDDTYAQAYVLHDWLYQSKMFDRKTCDLILWDALGLPYRAYDEANRLFRVICPGSARAAIYCTVRVGGQSSYV